MSAGGVVLAKVAVLEMSATSGLAQAPDLTQADLDLIQVLELIVDQESVRSATMDQESVIASSAADQGLAKLFVGVQELVTASSVTEPESAKLFALESVITPFAVVQESAIVFVVALELLLSQTK